MEGFKIQIMLQVIFHKEIKTGETKYQHPIYFSCKTQTNVNGLDIDNGLNTSYQIIVKYSKIAW